MTFHFIITLEFANGARRSLDGTYTTKPGQTRHQAYQAILEATKNDAISKGAVGPCSTGFFSLEPNELPVVAR